MADTANELTDETIARLREEEQERQLNEDLALLEALQEKDRLGL